MESPGWDMYRNSDQTIKELWSTVDVGLWEVHSQLSGYETAATLGERGLRIGRVVILNRCHSGLLGLMVEYIRREMILTPRGQLE